MTRKKFKQIRSQLEYTQKELGEVLGVSDRHIRRLENGYSPITKQITYSMKYLTGD